MVEQQQQTTINWLHPPPERARDHYRYALAIDLTAISPAPSRPVAARRSTSVLEDFDTCIAKRAAGLFWARTEHHRPGKTEIFRVGQPPAPQRPRGPLLRHLEERALPLSRLHTLTLLCGEHRPTILQEHGPEYGNRRARELYAEIGEVEEEHVTFYESLLDPTETLLQRQVQHQLMEVYNYQHCYAHETDPRIRLIWDEFLHMELEHLQLWGQMLAKYEGIEPEALFGDQLTVEFRFQENKDYIARPSPSRRPAPVRGPVAAQADCRQTGPPTATRRSSTLTGSPQRNRRPAASRQDPPERPGTSCWPRPARSPSRSDSERGMA